MATTTRTPAAEIIERAKIERPLNWDELGSSAKDLWEDRQLRSIAKRKVALYTGFLFEDLGDDEPSHEANIFYTEDGRFDAAWSNTAVGLVTTRTFDTYADALRWLEIDGGYHGWTLP